MVLKFEKNGINVKVTDKQGNLIKMDKMNSNYGRCFGKETVFFAECEIVDEILLIKRKSKETF